MATGTIMPLPRFTGFDANGDPVAGGQLWTYIAGTSTPVVTYSDVALTVPQANPILLNSAGRPSNGTSELGIFLTPGSSYKFVLLSATGATIWTQDNVAAVPSSSLTVDVVGTAGEGMAAGAAVFLSDGSGGHTAGLWYRTTSTVAVASSAPRVVGIVTATIAAGAQGAIRIEGAVLIPGLTLTPGATYYVDAAVGAISPSVAQAFLRAIGVAQDVQTLILGAGVGVQPAGITFTTTLTGTQHNLAIPAGCSVVYLNGAAPLTLTGMGPGVGGQSVTLVNTSGFQVDLLNNNAGSSGANRFFNYIASPTSLAPSVGTGGAPSARYLYDNSVGLGWRLQQHEQGAWIIPPFSAAAFLGTGTMTWSVGGGNVGRQGYYLKGRTLTYAVYLTGTLIAGTGTPELRITLPAGFTLAAGGQMLGWTGAYGAGTCVVFVAAGSTFLSFYQVNPSTAWTVGTVAQFGATITVEVQ